MSLKYEPASEPGPTSRRRFQEQKKRTLENEPPPLSPSPLTPRPSPSRPYFAVQLFLVVIATQHAQTKESLKALEAVSAMAAVYPNPGILSTKITTRLGPTSDRAIAVIAITIAVIDF